MSALPKVWGVSRTAESPKAVLLAFDRPLTDDEVRALHDLVRAQSDSKQPAAPGAKDEEYTYASKQQTTCSRCGKRKHTPLRIDAMGGYVCLTCIDQKLGSLLGEFGYDYSEAEAIRDLPSVDEAIQALIADNTGDNATEVVQAVLRAIEPKQQPAQAVLNNAGGPA